MKVVIFCGGLGSRLEQETRKVPKPMVKVGKYPILYHIINIYRKYGYNDFILALGYKKNIIIKYFKKKKINIKFIDTGRLTQTGGRLFKLKKLLLKDRNFFCTYGDGLSNINIKKLLKYHVDNKKIVTITAVRPPSRFGELKMRKNNTVSFKEKPQASEGWINGGFFCINTKIFPYLKKNSSLEKDIFEKLSKKNNISAFKHNGFWQCMDTIREKNILNNLVKKNRGKVPWIN